MITSRSNRFKIAGRDALAPLGHDTECQVHDLFDPLTSQRGGEDDRRPWHELEGFLSLLDELAHRLVVLLDQVPLVDDEHDPFLGFSDVSGHMLILRRERLGRIQHQNGDVAALDRSEERSTLNFSMPRSMRPRRRIPAVSINRSRCPAQVISVSTASRVVPGTSETIWRLSPRIELSKADLPTFGRPTIAIAGKVLFRLLVAFGWRQLIDDMVEQVSDAHAMQR